MALGQQPPEDNSQEKQSREAALPMKEENSSGIFDLDVTTVSTWGQSI